jgi:hypothetical protein
MKNMITMIALDIISFMRCVGWCGSRREGAVECIVKYGIGNAFTV